MKTLASETLNVALSAPVVVVDFMAEWCQPCKPVTAMLERVAVKHPKANFYQANVDTLGDWATSLHISSVPTIVIFTNGQPVTTVLSGQITGPRIEQILMQLGV